MSAGKKELILELQKFYVALKKVAWILHRRNHLWWRLINVMIHNTPGKCFTKAFMQMVTLWDFTHKLYCHCTQHNDNYHKKVLLSSFHLKGHTPGFQSKKILWSIIISTVPQESAVQLWVSIEKISSTDFRLNDAN